MNKKKLQKLLNNAALAHNAAILADRALAEFEMEHWGFEHGDRDLDYIIDAVSGGSGISRGMTADEFIEIMNAAADG